MGCEPRGFGWSATVEVCSARVTRLVTDQEKSKKISGTQLVPGTGLGGLIPGLLASGPGRSRCLAPGVWTRFASIPTRGPQQVPGTGRVDEIREKRTVTKQVASRLRSDYNKGIFTKDKALQRCNLSDVKSEVEMWSGPLRGSAPFHSDFGTMR